MMPISFYAYSDVTVMARLMLVDIRYYDACHADKRYVAAIEEMKLRFAIISLRCHVTAERQATRYAALLLLCRWRYARAA